MSKVLIKINGNWADEFDVEGFTTMEQGKFNQMMQEIEASFDEDEYHNVYIGTNQGIEFFNFKQVESIIKVEDITEEEEIILKKFFGYSGDSDINYGLLTFDNLHNQVCNY